MRRVFLILPFLLTFPLFASEEQQGKIPYDKFEKDRVCATCHVDIARQHEQAMMSQAYTHAWDEIEYFELALPHAKKDPKVAGIKDGCNGCHAPMSFLAGDTPPPPPSAKSRANESVTCDICHTVTAIAGDTPYNFNHVVTPGRAKQGQRPGRKSPHHDTVENPLLRTAEFCGTCHNEKSPYDTWVKATHLEWKESPQAASGIVCQDCHMPPSKNRSATMGEDLPDMREHLFHGAHDYGKLVGAVEVRIHPRVREAEPGERMKLNAVVVNAKAGHRIPTGSAEERVVWLDVVATDAKGKSYHLPVDAKGFEGEEYTIASRAALAYQDIGEVRDVADFPGLARDGNVPDGDRIYRLPYLDPEGSHDDHAVEHRELRPRQPARPASVRGRDVHVDIAERHRARRGIRHGARLLLEARVVRRRVSESSARRVRGNRDRASRNPIHSRRLSEWRSHADRNETHHPRDRRSRNPLHVRE